MVDCKVALVKVLLVSGRVLFNLTDKRPNPDFLFPLVDETEHSASSQSF